MAGKAMMKHEQSTSCVPVPFPVPVSFPSASCVPSHSGAPELTGNQPRGIPLIRQYGAVVVGDNGGAAHPSGLLLPPFEVTLVRPPVDVNREGSNGCGR